MASEKSTHLLTVSAAGRRARASLRAGGRPPAGHVRGSEACAGARQAPPRQRGLGACVCESVLLLGLVASARAPWRARRPGAPRWRTIGSGLARRSPTRTSRSWRAPRFRPLVRRRRARPHSLGAATPRCTLLSQLGRARCCGGRAKGCCEGAPVAGRTARRQLTRFPRALGTPRRRALARPPPVAVLHLIVAQHLSDGQPAHLRVERPRGGARAAAGLSRRRARRLAALRRQQRRRGRPGS